jgi:maltose alpha-D-glucosyltransferase / alpha-amylase
MQLLFNFYLDANLFLALARQQAQPVARILEQLPPIPADGQWANFVRNQDELNLSHLSPEERDEVFGAFAPNKVERVFGRGIRRRLASMLGANRARTELIYSVLLSLPGTPVLGYGDEIGMGDDLGLPERLSVRTPMQWTAGRNAGFSDAPREKLIRPVIAEGPFGYSELNVERQRTDEDSLLRWFERVIALRADHSEIGSGSLQLIDSGDQAVLAHSCNGARRRLLALHNFSSERRTLRLPSGEVMRNTTEVFADTHYPGRPDDSGTELRPHGYRWFAGPS